MDVDLLVDVQSSKVGLLPDVIGTGVACPRLDRGVRAERLVYALAYNEYGTGPVLLASSEYLSDFMGGIVSDSESAIIGVGPVWVDRMPVSRRYIPEHPPGDAATFGMSFDVVFPMGVGIQNGALSIFTNAASPVPSTDFSIGAVQVQGRALYASLVGGVSGTDYQLRWSATGTDGSLATRTALVLCAQTS